MKIKQLSLTNFAGYEKVSVSFDDNVTYLIGNNGSGKSTIGITGIWFMFQSVAEKVSGGNNPVIGERFRFIGPKAATAKGEMILVDEKTGVEIKVLRKLTKTGSELSFEAPEGMELGQQWLNDLFNVFLIAPKKFTELSGIEQAKAIGIDTATYDKELAALKDKAKEIRIELKQFEGLQVVEPAERVDTVALHEAKSILVIELNQQYTANKAANKELRDKWENEKRLIDEAVRNHNQHILDLQQTHNECQTAYETLKKGGYDGKEVVMFLNELHAQIKPVRTASDEYPAEPTYQEEMPSDAPLKEIDEKIMAAGKTNEQAFLYDQYLSKKAAKEAKEKQLAENKEQQAKKEADRLAYIQSLKLPFSNMAVGEDGDLLLEGKPIKEPYFSTGELLKIVPILLSTANPELKYVFLQDFNLLDEDKQADIVSYLTGKDFQLVVELVGKEKIVDKNCILLRDNVVVESYETAAEPALNL